MILDMELETAMAAVTSFYCENIESCHDDEDLEAVTCILYYDMIGL